MSLSEVDQYGVPIDAFGAVPPAEFFEVLGRLLAVNGKIEYLKERLAHLPPSETNGRRKVEQFSRRYESGRLDRNTIVHSLWALGAHTENPEIILGVRYKTRGPASGEIATMSICDVPGSERDQVVAQYSLKQLQELLKRDVATMRIGMQAHSEVGRTWAALQAPPT